MIEVNDEHFGELIAQSMDEMPKTHMAAVKNVAIVYEDEPTEEQRQELELSCNQTLYGLYNGVPLSKRGGQTHYGPDKITIFKGPITRGSGTMGELKAQIKHTVWHEIAHYFGLNHRQIHQLENKNAN